MEAPNGFKGMTEVLRLRFTRAGRPTEGQYVETHRDLIQQPTALQETQGRVSQPPLLVMIHRRSQCLKVF